ncbi:MAG: NAD(P)H-dependent oxidoreductase, partial [Jatrophihabitantaceae bacterium]
MPSELMLICGSVRAGSTNAAALACASEQLPAGWRARSYSGLAELPHFNPDDDVEPLHPAVAELRGSVGNAGAL